MSTQQLIIFIGMVAFIAFGVWLRREYQGEICDLSGFIGLVRKRQENLPKFYILS